MAKENNGQSKKDLEPVLTAAAKVSTAKEALELAQAELSAHASAWMRKHGEKVERSVKNEDGTTRKVQAYRAKPVVIGDMLFEIRTRFNPGSTEPTFVLSQRDIG